MSGRPAAAPGRPVAARPQLAAGESIAGASGVLLLVAMLLPWYERETNIAGALIAESWTAWQILSVVAILLFAIAVTAVAVPLARLLREAPERFRDDRLLVALGVLALALVLFRLIDMPTPDIQPQPGDRVDSDRGPGLFLALLAAMGIAYGGRRDGRA
jgi:membrane protein YdbS with pleckstrin-like domain